MTDKLGDREMVEAQKAMEVARWQALMAAPYFARAIYMLQPYPSYNVNTLAVTPEWILLWNPAYMRSLTQMPEPKKKLAARMWHEPNHLLRSNFDRVPGGDPKLKNKASDLAINSSGRQNPLLDFGPDGLLPEQFMDKNGNVFPELGTMEQYYALLLEISDTSPDPGCGSGSGNGTGPDEQAAKDKLGGRTPQDIAVGKKAIADEIKNHEKNAGTVPGELSEFANLFASPGVVPWNVILRNIIGQWHARYKRGSGGPVSYARPNRRMFTQESPDILLPTRLDRKPNVAVILDTSGSMGTDLLMAAMRETASLLSVVAEEVWFLQVDTALQDEPKKIRAADLMNGIEFKGRGGTSFIPGFEAVDKLGEKIDLVVYATDGYGQAPDIAPRQETIWLLIGQNVHEPAKWGRYVHIEQLAATQRTKDWARSRRPVLCLCHKE